MTPTDGDEAIYLLLARFCPVHIIAMQEIKPTTNPDMQYIRHRFRCPTPNCGCEADFVDDKLKTDSLARTLIYIWQLESEKELALPE